MDLVNLTNYLVEQLLSVDKKVSVKQLDTEGDIVIQVLVPSDYMGAIIGKDGKVANSIRTIVQAASYANKLGRVRINIDVE